MIRIVLAAGLAGLIIFAAQAQGGPDSPATSVVGVPTTTTLSWDDWSKGLRAASPDRPQPAGQEEPADLDVVDAHWMALTMWGEARGSGEEAMRAVGHVIDNRRRLGRHGDFVTETVSEAWQFSCWNAGDPNRRAIEHIDDLTGDSRDFRMWQAARRIADEILSGRSDDPTGGALFYHANYVAPRWSRGVPPVARIGSHLFFLTARGA